MGGTSSLSSEPSHEARRRRQRVRVVMSRMRERVVKIARAIFCARRGGRRGGQWGPRKGEGGAPQTPSASAGEAHGSQRESLQLFIPMRGQGRSRCEQILLRGRRRSGGRRGGRSRGLDHCQEVPFSFESTPCDLNQVESASHSPVLNPVVVFAEACPASTPPLAHSAPPPFPWA